MIAPDVQLVRLDVGGEARWAARTQVGDAPLRVGLDELLRMSLDQARAAVESAGTAADLGGGLLPPVDSQEVWGAGVAYERSTPAPHPGPVEVGVAIVPGVLLAATQHPHQHAFPSRLVS